MTSNARAQKILSLHEGKMAIANHYPFVLFAGLNVLESRDLAMQVATAILEMCQELSIPFVFKSSFDKANRSSIHSYRGPGLDKGLEILREIKSELQVPIITDIHEPHQAEVVAEVADVIGIPAFLCRQTDLLAAAAKTQRILNIKKMQMMAPWDMKNVVKKLEEMGHSSIILCERGHTMGYNNLVVDPLSFPILKELHYPVIFDVTHALQLPGGLGDKTAGRGEYAEALAKAGLSQGIAGLYIETHPDPTQAKCDGPSATPLNRLKSMLQNLKRMDELVKAEGQ